MSESPISCRQWWLKILKPVKSIYEFGSLDKGPGIELSSSKPGSRKDESDTKWQPVRASRPNSLYALVRHLQKYMLVVREKKSPSCKVWYIIWSMRGHVKANLGHFVTKGFPRTFRNQISLNVFLIFFRNFMQILDFFIADKMWDSVTKCSLMNRLHGSA